MLATLKNNIQVQLQLLCSHNYSELAVYLNQLSEPTKKRFGPHAFNLQTITQIFSDTENYTGYIAVCTSTNKIVAYAIVKKGFLLHDSERLNNHGLLLSNTSDCTFAPSVADAWQNCGLGKKLFVFILNNIKQKGIKRIILWGGVQAGNNQAVNYYRKNDFTVAGEFDYNGHNFDMVYNITT
jgi:GNAT superfamily N-acetyltransferase